MNLKRLLLLINLCLAGLVLWTGASIYLTWRSAKEEKGQPRANITGSGRTVKRVSDRPKRLKDYRTIVDRDIFDTTKEAPAKKEEKIAKVTKLNLKLRGTVIGENRHSYAIIEDGITMKEELYSPNDFVQGARIVEILTDQVILDLKGSKETLIMTEEISPPAPKVRIKRRAKAPRPRPRRPKRLKRPKI